MPFTPNPQSKSWKPNWFNRYIVQRGEINSESEQAFIRREKAIVN